MVNTLLTELDGLEPRKQVFVIGATNRPDILDPAMVRPGRLDKLLYVDLPTPEERSEILRAQTKRTPLAAEVDLGVVARDPRCDGFSGADLSALVREAAVAALREVFSNVEFNDDDDDVEGEKRNEADEKIKVPEKVEVGMQHFEMALGKVSPSVSIAQRRRFELLRVKFAGQPVGRGKEGREKEGGAKIEEVSLT